MNFTVVHKLFELIQVFQGYLDPLLIYMEICVNVSKIYTIMY